MNLGFGNNVRSTLASDINATQTTIRVMPGTGGQFAKTLLPESELVNPNTNSTYYSKLTLTDAQETAFEICHLMAVSDDTLTVIRGQEGTFAKGWSLGDVASNFATRGSENNFVQIEDLQNGRFLSANAGGTENTLTVSIPSMFYINNKNTFDLRHPLTVFPQLSNSGPCTLQLTVSGMVVGTFPIVKGNFIPLEQGDINNGIPFLVVFCRDENVFQIINPGNITDGDLRDDLAAADGLKYIGICPDVATLRTIEPVSANQQIYVLRHSESNAVSLRRYYYHQSDTTSLDDDGRIIVTAGGKRWNLIFNDGYLTPEIFGAIGDAVYSMATDTATGTDNTIALQNMFNSASAVGVAIKFPDGKKYLSGSLYLYKDDVYNPKWPSRAGRISITGMSTGHATGDVENVGAAIIHKPGQTTPLISIVGAFSIENPTGMGGYFQLEKINLIGSPNTSDVLLIQGSQGAIELNDMAVKFTNPSGNGVTQKTVWDITHRNTLIRGGATGLGDWTGIGLNITSDGSDGQTNMSVYTNVECYRCGYGIRIGRRKVPTGTFGPIVFIGGQTSNSDQHGIWLDGGVIAFTSIGQQHEGAQRNGIRIDRYLEDGTPASDIPRNIKFINTYTTGCGRVDDGSGDSYAIYVVNGDGIEFDSPVFNTVGNGLVFSAGEVDNLLIRRPAFRTVRAFGASNGYGIRAFGTQDASKRQYLEHPTFNQNPQTQIDILAHEIFDRGSAGGRLSFATGSTTPSISLGGQAASEAVSQLNFNYQTAVTISDILGGRRFQTLLITFSNTLVTIPNNRTTFFLNGGAFTPTSRHSVLFLFFDGNAWIEISRSLN